MKTWLGSFVVLTLCAVSVPSAALLAPGATAPRVRVVDADDRVVELGGRPTLLVYEDKESATLNAQLKSELSVLARGDRYRTSVALLPVADVRKYDFWPARGFVKDAIRSESKKVGATIYCDWDGRVAQALEIQHGTSTVMLLDRQGKVLFAYAGKVPASETRRLIELLRTEVEQTR